MAKYTTTIGKLIADARRAAGVTQAQVRLALGFTYNIVAGWEGGNRKPSRDDWDRLVTYFCDFGVELVAPEDALTRELALPEGAVAPKPSQSPRVDTDMGRRLAHLRQRGQLSQTDVAAALDVFPTQVGRWEKGLSSPTHAQVRQLVRLFNTTYDYLYDGVRDSESYDLVRAQRDQLRRALAKVIDPETQALLAEAV